MAIDMTHALYIDLSLAGSLHYEYHSDP